MCLQSKMHGPAPYTFKQQFVIDFTCKFRSEIEDGGAFIMNDPTPGGGLLLMFLDFIDPGPPPNVDHLEVTLFSDQPMDIAKSNVTRLVDWVAALLLREKAAFAVNEPSAYVFNEETHVYETRTKAFVSAWNDRCNNILEDMFGHHHGAPVFQRQSREKQFIYLSCAFQAHTRVKISLEMLEYLYNGPDISVNHLELRRALNGDVEKVSMQKDLEVAVRFTLQSSPNIQRWRHNLRVYNHTVAFFCQQKILMEMRFRHILPLAVYRQVAFEGRGRFLPQLRQLAPTVLAT